MMADKPAALIAYALIGIALGLWPTILTFFRAAAPGPAPAAGGNGFRSTGVTALFAVLAFVGLRFAASPLLIAAIVSIAALAAFSGRRMDAAYALSVIIGLTLATTLPWWRRGPNGLLSLSAIELCVFAAGTLSVLLILGAPDRRPNISSYRRSVAALQMSLFVAAAFLCSFTTGLFNNSNVLITVWHHWGAYISPSELLLAGAKLFSDFPAQYGFGPTVLIASLCRSNCWTGMYYLVGCTTFLFALFVCLIAFQDDEQGLPQRGIILLLCLFCCFLWNAYPPELALPTFTPSVTGLRFLPLLALVSFLLLIDRELDGRPKLARWGHAAWAVAALWSPESAFYATFVWWPYYLFLCAVDARNNRSRLLRLASGAGTLLLVLLALISMFVAGYWLVYRDVPTAYGYFAYILNPPGPLPIDPKGAILFFIAALGLGFAANWRLYRRSGNSRGFRRGFLLLLQAYATFSYFFGRSHDNNILNLLPFVLLLLLHVRSTSAADRNTRGAAVALLACFVGWVGLFGWSVWREAAAAGNLLQFDSRSFQKMLTYENPATAALVSEHFRSGKMDVGDPADAARGISFIRQHFGEPTAILDNSLDLTSTDRDMAWNALHGLCTFAYMPSSRRSQFLVRTAHALKRAGWLIVDKKFNAEGWLDDFDSAYIRTQTLDFGSYYAIRYLPSPTPIVRRRYAPGDKIEFTSKEGANSRRFLVSGWEGSYETGTWSSGTKSAISLPIQPLSAKTLTIQMELNPLVAAGLLTEQKIIVYAGGGRVAEFAAAKDGVYPVRIPADAVKDDLLELVLEIPTAASPKKLGLWGMESTVGIYLKSIAIEAAAAPPPAR